MPEPKYAKQAAENAREARTHAARARARAGQATRDRATNRPEFDWDRAITGLRAMLAEIYR